MKFSLLVLLAAISTTTFAQSSPCARKQIQAARAQLASVLRTSINNVKFVKYQGGPWSEAMANNSGSDYVTLRVDRFVQTYTVRARQIGNSNDCNVTGIEF